MQEIDTAGRELYFCNHLVGVFLAHDLPNEMRVALPAAVPSTPDDRANHLAVLLLGFGTEHAAKWAQQRLQLAGQINMPAAMQMSTVAKLRELAFSNSSDFSNGTGMLDWRLGQVLCNAGMYAAALKLQTAGLHQAAKLQDAASKRRAASIKASLAALHIERALPGDLAKALGYAREAPEELKNAGASDQVVLQTRENYALLLVKLHEGGYTSPAGTMTAAIEDALPQAAQVFEEAVGYFTTEAEEATRKAHDAAVNHREDAGKLQTALLECVDEGLISRNNWGYVLALQGKLDKAAKQLKTAHAHAVTFLSPNHRTTAVILDSMAYLAKKQKDKVTSKRLYQEALSMKTVVLGPRHPETLATKQRLERV